MKRLIATAALASLSAGCATVDGSEFVDRDVPERVLEETAGTSSQHLVLPGLIGGGLFFAYLIVTKAS